MKRVLYIDHRDTSLEIDGAALRVRLPDHPPQTLPLALLERVVLISDTTLDSSLLATLADAGVGLVAFGGRGGRRVAHVVGALHGDARIRLNQALAASDLHERNILARHFVRSKLRAQQRLLRSAEEQRPDLRHAMVTGVEALGRALDSLRRDRPGDDHLRGLEGAAAAAYFRGFCELFPARLGFLARVRRPPRDPVNALLSLGYTLAMQSAVQSCWVTGLDPGVGFLHAPAHGRPALACDLLEPWRATVDQFVWTLFRQETLRPEHFGVDGSGACLLGKAGRRHFYAAWQTVRPGLDRGMRRYARALAHILRHRAGALPVSADQTP